MHVPTPATWAALARMQLQGAINTHMFFQHQIDALRQRGMEARARALRRREGTYTAEDYLADEGARRRHAESGQDLPLIDKKTTESLDKLFSPAMAQKRFEKLMASPHQERDPSYWGPFLKSLKNGQQRAVVERVLGLRKNDEGRSHPEDLRRAREQEALRLLRIIEASMRPEVIGNSAPGGPSGVPEGGVDVPDEEGMERMRDHLRVAALETAFGKNPLWSTEGDDATVGVEAGGDKAEEAAPGDETDEAALGGEAGQAAPGDEVRSIEHDASGSSDAGKD